jgi:hypothetical protein
MHVCIVEDKKSILPMKSDVCCFAAYQVFYGLNRLH